MIYYKNRIIIGGIIAFIKATVFVLYKLICLLNLQFIFLVGILGLILYFTGVLTNSEAVQTIYIVLAIITVIFTFTYVIAKPSKKKKPVIVDKNEQNVPILSKKEQKKAKKLAIKKVKLQAKIDAQKVEQGENLNSNFCNENNKTFESNSQVYSPPSTMSSSRMFRVKQNPHYIMKEYDDKVELFYETKNGLKYIRTDLKRNS